MSIESLERAIAEIKKKKQQDCEYYDGVIAKFQADIDSLKPVETKPKKKH